MTPADRRAYDEHINAIMIQNDVLDSAKLEGLIGGRAESRAEGVAEGVMKEKRKNAQAMKALNIPIETISQITGLSAENSMLLAMKIICNYSQSGISVIFLQRNFGQL